MSILHSTFALYSRRLLSSEGLIEGTLIVKDGIISDIKKGKCEDKSFPFLDARNSVIMPGIIDTHVHINEPGRTEWEGFESITKAAIAGGITTLVDMPLNASPVTTSKQNLEIKLNAAEGKLHCNVGFWGGIVPENCTSLDELCQSGILGIKAFLTHSGIDDFPNVSVEELKKGLETLKKYQLPLLAHAELDEHHQGIETLKNNPTNYLAYLQSRPNKWEDDAVDRLIELCETFDTPIHIVHLSSANSLEKIKQAKAKGLKLTVETCPQYLYFNAESIPNANTLFKCAPPIREKENNEKLWKAIKEGVIDFIVTDHSPSTPSLKEIESGNFLRAWGGISSIQFSLPIVWTEAQKRGFTIAAISRLMSENTAKFMGLGDSKGLLKAGYDADIVVWNPEEEFTVNVKDIHFKHKISPYTGEKLCGVVKQCFVGGNAVFENGNFLSLPVGKKILHENYGK